VPEVWYQQPLYYKGNRFCVASSGKDVVWPAYSELMDFELELACIIGKKGKDISHANAKDHIFGYTIYNDFSARDTQMQESGGPLGPAKSKDFDDSIILGPVIVTADELQDPYQLRMQARINGETWCDNNSSTIHWKFSDMIAHISKSETLHPGEVIGSGTVGFGCGLEHLRFLNDGDVVELEIEHIGVISNKVVRR
jgi:2-keto-4-pentenoate hydratase/2-oxohepta-3-ene-1,7-dioic acid hydratase in catechol pathway